MTSKFKISPYGAIITLFNSYSLISDPAVA